MKKRLSVRSSFFILFFFSSVSNCFAGQLVAQFNEKLSSEKITQFSFLVDPCSSMTINNDIDFLSPGQDVNHSVTIIDPKGKSIDYYSDSHNYPGLIVKESKPMGKSDSARKYLVIQNPAVGKWSIILGQASNEKTVSKFFNIFVSVEEPTYKLDFSNVALEAKVGEKVILKAGLKKNGEPVIGAKVKMQLDEWRATRKEEIIFNDKGLDGDKVKNDGIYTGTFTAKHAGEIYVKLTATDDQTFQRESSTEIRVSDRAVRFIRVLKDEGVDKNGDGKFDLLRIFLEVEVLGKEGRYSLNPKLYDSKGYPVGEPRNLPPFTQVLENTKFIPILPKKGIQEMEVDFSAEEILRSKSNGPFTLSVKFYDQAVFGIPFGNMDKVYTTGKYILTDFNTQNITK